MKIYEIVAIHDGKGTVNVKLIPNEHGGDDIAVTKYYGYRVVHGYGSTRMYIDVDAPDKVKELEAYTRIMDELIPHLRIQKIESILD